jgi:hypothetical protein
VTGWEGSANGAERVTEDLAPGVRALRRRIAQCLLAHARPRAAGVYGRAGGGRGDPDRDQARRILRHADGQLRGAMERCHPGLLPPKDAGSRPLRPDTITLHIAEAPSQRRERGTSCEPLDAAAAVFTGRCAAAHAIHARHRGLPRLPRATGRSRGDAAGAATAPRRPRPGQRARWAGRPHRPPH